MGFFPFADPSQTLRISSGLRLRVRGLRLRVRMTTFGGDSSLTLRMTREKLRMTREKLRMTWEMLRMTREKLRMT
jgi:hypothetical protein